MKTFYLIILTFFLTISNLFAGSNNPTVYITPATISTTEGNSGTSTVTLTIAVSECPDLKDIIFDWTTSDNTAVAGSDYVANSGTVTFSEPSCVTEQNISIVINGDTDIELDQNFHVYINDNGTNPAQSFVTGISTSTVTIINDDALTEIPPSMNDIPDQSAANGVAYLLDISSYVTITNSDPILDYNLTGTLPAGISFDSSTGILSGNPSVDGNTTLSVTATDNDGVSNSDTFTLTVSTSTVPMQDQYSCGMFSNVLTSYHSITSDGTNDQACFTGNISYPEGNITGEILCNPDGCGGGNVCDQVDPPSNQLDYTLNSSSRLGILESGLPATLHNLEYGDISIGTNLLLDPQTANAQGVNVMMFGDVDITGSNSLSFMPGDYYFNSLKFSDNNPRIVLPQGGPVRIFIQNDFIVTKNGLDINEFGSPSELFVYIKGDLDFLTNGNVEIIKGFFYVEGSAKFDANSNLFNVHGGITSEGPLIINGNNGNFYQDSSAGNLGYGGCQLCYVNDSANFNSIPTYTPILNISNDTLYNIVVGETMNPSIVGFVFGTGLDTLDQDGAHVGNGGSQNGSENVYDFGDNYSPTGVGTYFWQTAQSSPISYSDWNQSAHYTSTYTSSGGKNYSINMDQCSEKPEVLITQVGVFDAWEVGRGLDDGSNDRNLVTEVTDRNFNLTLASLNIDRNARENRNVNLWYYLYDYSTNKQITDADTFYAGTPADGLNRLFQNITGAYRNVGVVFAYCEDVYGNIVDNSACTLDPGDTRRHEVGSTDRFSIRPDRFEIDTPAGANINLLRSSQLYDFSVNALSNTNNIVTNYDNIPIDNTSFTIERLNMYQQDNTINNGLNGTLTLNTPPANIISGVGPARIDFDDVGKTEIRLIDNSWTSIDSADTPDECSSTGRFICGSKTATFIPSSFTLTNVNLNNNNQGTFTYISDDLNVSAFVTATITAINAAGNPVTNFSDNVWENPINLTINNVTSTATVPTLSIANVADTSNFDFTNGVVTMNPTETDLSKKLMFNYKRNNTDALNPFVINGSNVNISVSSTYTDGADTAIINGTNTAAQNATFIYGRTNVPRQRFVGASGTAFIFYESFCNGIDSNGNTCNPALLPNGAASQKSDDYRWFINTLHTPASGNAGTVTRRGGGSTVTASSTNGGTPPDSTTLTYNGTNFPYKTTMENNASTWLLYNQYQLNDPTNEFDVEFVGAPGDWTGLHETDSSTRGTSSGRTNRRSTW